MNGGGVYKSHIYRYQQEDENYYSVDIDGEDYGEIEAYNQAEIIRKCKEMIEENFDV